MCRDPSAAPHVVADLVVDQDEGAVAGDCLESVDLPAFARRGLWVVEELDEREAVWKTDVLGESYGCSTGPGGEPDGLVGVVQTSETRVDGNGRARTRYPCAPIAKQGSSTPVPTRSMTPSTSSRQSGFIDLVDHGGDRTLPVRLTAPDAPAVIGVIDSDRFGIDEVGEVADVSRSVRADGRVFVAVHGFANGGVEAAWCYEPRGVLTRVCARPLPSRRR